jgi:aldose 1-epimerase
MAGEPPSGKQLEIVHGNQRAVVVEVGAGLRTYEVDGQSVLDGFSIDKMADGGRGQPLLPWPNRLADGRYEFGGQTHQVAVDEVARNNANHGFTRWLNWSVVDQSPEMVRLEYVLHPRPGYPFTLQLQIEYTVSDDGLTVRTSARNVGDAALPFGAGQHPYFTAGTSLVDDATLHVPATSRLELDAERRLPTGRVLPLEGSDLDFREPRAIGSRVIDDCFCDLVRDADGRVRISLAAQRTISVWMDEHYKYAQVFSGDTLAADRRRRGLAIEPMTCPPNAFQSGEALIVLQPGDQVLLMWGVRV